MSSVVAPTPTQHVRICRGKKRYFISYNHSEGTSGLRNAIATIEHCTPEDVSLWFAGTRLLEDIKLERLVDMELVVTIGKDEAEPKVDLPKERVPERVMLPESLIEYLEEMKLT
eukprot:PhF_6_TR31273/c0_g1_i1/m.45816